MPDAPAKPVPAAPLAPEPPLAIGQVGGTDRRTAERLRKGKLAVDGRLDLHGFTQAEAHAALARFLKNAQRRGARCVVVVTGKGLRAGGGILRAAVPRWLNEPDLRPLVLSVSYAQPQDGGEGALYILLRRIKMAPAS